MVCEVREAVRINHHRNCLLCHPPSQTGQDQEVPGVIPIPGQSFPTSPKEAYGKAQSFGEPMVRADTTYLRQDFSVMMPVENAAPWPEMQRFYFLVRTRPVEGKELATLQRNVQARALVQIWPRALVSEHVLPVVRTEGTAILPLCITDSVSVSNGDPSPLKNALTVTNISVSEPRNHLARLAFGTATFHVVIRESDIKRILARHEIDRDIISARDGVRVVIAAVAVVPIAVPGASIIGDGIVAAGPFTDPEDCRDNPEFPWVTARAAAGA